MKAAWTDRDYFYLLLDYAVAGDLLTFLKKNGKYGFSEWDNFANFR